LVEILVRQHGWSRAEAVSAVPLALLHEGYPADATVVAAVDGFDIMQGVLSSQRHRRPH